MIIGQDINLQGKFKFDVFNKNGQLKTSTEYIPNFITPTGLSYPTLLPFAECFRYLSIGSGTSQNSILGNGTTGLSEPLKDFSYIGGNLSDDNGPNFYELNGCGYRENLSGVSLFRAWRVPTGDGNFFSGDYVFKEFMLSPGSPLTSDLTCPELDDFLSLYPSICTYTKAFTRVIQDLSVSQNDYVIVYYQLNVLTNTGVNFFKININNVGAVGDLSNWGGTISGVYGLVHHGIKLVRSEDISSLPSNIDQSYSSSHFGDSFNPPLGSPMEPSCPKSRYVAYLSTDDTQFVVSEISGAFMDTGLYYPYNINGKSFPSGIEYFHSQPTFETFLGQNIPNWLKNIRKDEGNNFPCSTDFRLTCDDSNIDLSLKTINADAYNVSYDTYKVSDRTRTKRLSAEFRGISVNDNIKNSPIRSLVLAYKSRDGSDYYPFCDLLFGSKVNGIIPDVFTGTYTYDVSNAGFSYLDGVNNLTLEFKLTWGSPCSPGVQGC